MCMRYECDLDHKDLGREAETILVCSIRALLVFARVQVYCTCILYSRNLCLCTRCALPCQDTQHVVCALPCQDTRPTMSRHTPTPYHVKTHDIARSTMSRHTTLHKKGGYKWKTKLACCNRAACSRPALEFALREKWVSR